MVIVVTSIMSDDGECGNIGAYGADVGLASCEMERRSFANAFTTTCICDAIKIEAMESEDVP